MMTAINKRERVEGCWAGKKGNSKSSGRIMKVSTLTLTTIITILIYSSTSLPHVQCAENTAWSAHDGTQSDAMAQNEAPATNVPKIETEGTNHTVYDGETVLLKCQVRDLGPFVQLWRKGQTLLFAGSLRVHQESRVQLKDGNLEIATVHTNDTGPYICQVSTNPTIEITHHLEVLAVKPTVKSGSTTHHGSSPVSGTSSKGDLLSMMMMVMNILCSLIVFRILKQQQM